MNVTVHGLSPSSFFLFRVYSVSELNQLENNKDNWNYAKVFVETKGKVKCELRTQARSPPSCFNNKVLKNYIMKWIENFDRTLAHLRGKIYTPD